MPSNYVYRSTAAFLFFSFSFTSFGRTEASEIPFFRSYADITSSLFLPYICLSRNCAKAVRQELGAEQRVTVPEDHRQTRTFRNRNNLSIQRHTSPNRSITNDKRKIHTESHCHTVCCSILCPNQQTVSASAYAVQAPYPLGSHTLDEFEGSSRTISGSKTRPSFSVSNYKGVKLYGRTQPPRSGRNLPRNDTRDDTGPGTLFSRTSHFPESCGDPFVTWWPRNAIQSTDRSWGSRIRRKRMRDANADPAGPEESRTFRHLNLGQTGVRRRCSREAAHAPRIRYPHRSRHGRKSADASIQQVALTSTGGIWFASRFSPVSPAINWLHLLITRSSSKLHRACDKHDAIAMIKGLF